MLNSYLRFWEDLHMKRNKTASRWISCLLCMAMMLSLFSGITVLAAEKAASGEEDKVLFSTRFKTQEEFSNFADVPVEVSATLKYAQRKRANR